MKILKKLLPITLVFTLLMGCQRNITSYETKDTNLTGVVTSDLHYTDNQDAISSIISLTQHTDLFMDCLMNQVIDLHPDVFIATGDITNQGGASSFQNLAKYLQRLTDEDITVIVTTGNHDYGRNDMTSFEKYLFPLLDIDSRDPNSMSYTTIIDNTCFIAMDDGYESNGEIGSFSKQTMTWLQQQLKNAKNNQYKIIFLAHHSVLFDDQDPYQRYAITNTDLKELLEEYNVRICFTGHQHGQGHMVDGDMHEIISAMPISGSNILGTFEISDQDFSYETIQIDFEAYASTELLDIYYNIQASSATRFYDTYVSILEKSGMDTEDYEGILSVFGSFMTCAQDGTLALHYDEIKNDPYYEKMLVAFADTNYGPWIKRVMENIPQDASSLQFTW